MALRCGIGMRPMTGIPGLNNVDLTPEADDAQLLLDVASASKLFAISRDHLRRLSDSGQAPQPMRHGGAIRCRGQEAERCIAGGPMVAHSALPWRGGQRCRPRPKSCTRGRCNCHGAPCADSSGNELG